MECFINGKGVVDGVFVRWDVVLIWEIVFFSIDLFLLFIFID